MKKILAGANHNNTDPVDGITRERHPAFALLTIAWVVAAFFLARLLAGLGVALLRLVGIKSENFDQNLYTTVASVTIYAVLLLIIIGFPRLLKLWSGRIGYRRLFGLTRLLQWRDIVYAAVGFVMYFALGIVVALIIGNLVPGYNADQAQDIGFSKTLSAGSAVLAFVVLVVVAPVIEEIIFRGYLFGTLRRTLPVWPAILITSALFGLVHGQWNVGITVFVMSIVSCVLRLRTGSLWPSILLHMMKNGLAFYVLYVASSSIL